MQPQNQPNPNQPTPKRSMDGMMAPARAPQPQPHPQPIQTQPQYQQQPQAAPVTEVDLNPLQSEPIASTPYIQPPAIDEPTSPIRSNDWGSTLRLAFSWGTAIGIALLTQRFAFQSYRVFGQSMEPTLSEGNYLIISKLGKVWAGLTNDYYIPERGEIIIVQSPNGTRLVKRVIGLPGETVTVNNGAVTVKNVDSPNGFNPYQLLGLDEVETSGSVFTEVPPAHVFVIGDNRLPGGSADSRQELGPVPEEAIIGNLSVRLWPLSGIQTDL